MNTTNNSHHPSDGRWTAVQCAAYLEVSIADVDRLVRQEELPHIRVEDDFLFVPDVIRAWSLIRQIEWPAGSLGIQRESLEAAQASPMEELERLRRSQERLNETLRRVLQRRQR